MYPPLETTQIHKLWDSECRINILRTKLEHARPMNEPAPDEQLAAEPDDNIYEPWIETNPPPSIKILTEAEWLERTEEPGVDPEQVFLARALADAETTVVEHAAFKLNRGDNSSTRTKDAWATDRIAEILSKIEFGADLTPEQLERVRDLITEFADIWALSMSKVQYVNWHSHHLDVDPDVKLPRKMLQHPMTEKQKVWYYKILDEMEVSHVIQKVPGEFLKCLNSTNLAPKEKGKTGASRVEVLRKVNTECIKNGCPPFWEEVRGLGESDDAMLDAVENEGTPQEHQTKWRVCHAFMALNRATKVPSFPQGDLTEKHQFAAGHCWASVIDLTAGYYAIQLDDESVPYTAFSTYGCRLDLRALQQHSASSSQSPWSI